MLNNLMKKIKKVQEYLNYRIWIDNLTKYSGMKAFSLRSLKVIMITITDFFKDHCNLRASALTYSTLLAIVPLFAVVFSVLKGFGFQNKIGTMILNKITGNSVFVVNSIITYINNTNVKTLGVIGGVTLLFTAISLFSNIERSLNEIMGVKVNRNFFRKVTDYLFAIMVLPILLTVGASVTAQGANLSMVQKALSVKVLNFLYYTITPYLLIWLTLTLFYLFLTNTKVKFIAGMWGGIVAGTLWQIAQNAYIHFQIGFKKYNIIYGSFAQVIIVFVWIYISWAIILLGAEVVFAVQNYRIYQKEGKSKGISFGFKIKTTLIVLNLILKNFKKGNYLSAEEIISLLKSPIKLTNAILFELTEENILAESHKGDKKVFIPAVPIETITVSFVIKKMMSHGISDVNLISDNSAKAIELTIKKYENLLDKNFSKNTIVKL